MKLNINNKQIKATSAGDINAINLLVSKMYLTYLRADRKQQDDKYNLRHKYCY